MFRFEGFCDDKNVTKLMIAITGMAIDFKIVPVINAQKKNGKLVAQTSGKPLDLLVDHIKQHKIETLTPAQMRDFLTSIGRSPGSYTNYVSQAIEAKILKRKPGSGPSNMLYMVNK